jgi:Uma2 family endonuclease
MVIATERRYSLDEYRSREASAEERHEYRNGEIVPMPGGSANHSRLAGCLYVLLDRLLMDSDCEVFNSDLRLWIPEVQRGTYPDVMVTDGAPIFNDDRADEILNPVLIAEVLSPSTEAYDRGDKFDAYRTLPTLHHYLLIYPHRPHVEHYEKIEDGRWQLTIHKTLESRVMIHKPAIEMPLAELYRRADFSRPYEA